MACFHLALALVVVVVYGAWIWFLMAAVGPNLRLILEISLVGGCLYLLARAFTRVFKREGRGWVYWLPATTAASYLYIEYVQWHAAASTATVGSGLTMLTASLPLPSIVSLLLGPAVAEWPAKALLFADSVLIGATLYPCVLLGRGLRGTRMDESEPAFIWYFHGEAFSDLTKATLGFWRDLFGITQALVQLILKTTIITPWWWLLWPLGITAFLGLGLAGLQAGLAIGIFLSAFGLGSALVWAIAHYLSFLMRGFERAVLKVRAGYVKCPQALCSEPIPLPVFRCPQCRAAHEKLLPGRNGIFARRCRCGTLLPTLNWFGKSRLPSECCHCGKSLGEEMFGANLHLPIYGGRSAGKSTYLAAATDVAMADASSDMAFDWVMERDQKQFEAQWLPVLRRGELLSATIAKLPDAFLLSARAAGGLPVSVYLYDPSGEAMANEADLGEHGFVGYSGGILLIVDPLSFESVRSEIEGLPMTAPSVAPVEVVQRVVSQLESLAGLSRAKRFDRPVAVVVSKADLPPVARRLSPDSDSDSVREWLAELDPSLVHNLETRFSRLSFFAVSALESSRSGKARERTLAPLTWLLSSFGVLSRPRLTRWGGVALEATAAVGLFILGLVVPIVLSFHLLRVW